MKKNEIKTSLHKKIPMSSNQINISADEISKIIGIIYDENFIQLLNSLSTKIKTYYVKNQSTLSKMKSLVTGIELTQDTQQISPSLSLFEETFETFYSEAKTIFKQMKQERNGRIQTLEILQNKNPTLRHFINQTLGTVEVKSNQSTQNNSNTNSTPSLPNTIPNNNDTTNTSLTGQHSEINKINYCKIKHENALLKKKIEILERNNSNSRPSPKSSKSLKLNYISNNTNGNEEINRTTANINASSQSYTKIVSNVTNSISTNINSNLQNEQIKVKSDLYNLANEVNKFLLNLKYLEKNSKGDNVALIKSNVEKGKRNLNKLCLAFLTNMSLSANRSTSLKSIDTAKSNKTVSNFNINNNITIQNGNINEEINKLKEQNEKLTNEVSQLNKENLLLKNNLENQKKNE